MNYVTIVAFATDDAVLTNDTFPTDSFFISL